MIEKDNILPDWISRQARLEGKVNIDAKFTNENAFWYRLSSCCPLIFECYAIILHPYWINWKVKESLDSGIKYDAKQIVDYDFEAVSWKNFFELFNENFDFKTAYETDLRITEKILSGNWPPYLWSGEGELPTEELRLILSHIKQLSGDVLVNYYYDSRMTKSWDRDLIFQGLISEFDNLIKHTEVRGNPTAIYPDNKEWCIVSNYDLSFSYVGGPNELINLITLDTNNVYHIEPLFKEKKKFLF